MLASAFAALQRILPQHLVTKTVWRIARIRNRSVKNFLITRFVAAFDVDVSDARQSVPNDYATFNDFFIRELRDGARPVDQSPDAITSPVDGTVSSVGRIRSGQILQAKGIDYTLQDLLAADVDEASVFNEGFYATLYLAPYNYHRVHAPFDGELVAAQYVPGDLFSVNEATVARIQGLFRRNERLVMRFATPAGPAVLIFVGALNVGSISTPWTGEVRPRKTGVVEAIELPDPRPVVTRGDLLGWFNMGSTVILLLPERRADWREDLTPGKTLRMGERIGQTQSEAL